MVRWGSVVTAGALVVLAACSSGGESSPETTSLASTILSTTAAPASTTSPPTTTSAPTTTIDPAVALAAEVEADFREADRLGREASMDPFDADKEAAALDRRLGVIADNLAAKLADWRERNYALRENPAVPASIVIEVPATLVLKGADVAEMQICEVNPWIIVELGAGPNGTESIVDPAVSASRATVFMRRVDGVWKFEGANQIALWDGATSCPPE